MPIQFHTGLGDPDLDLTLVDPAALRFLFSERFRAAPIVLLHTGYPYVRSLAYCAAMFPNVYADMGESILFAAGEATQIYRELLGPRAGEQAPVPHRRVARPGAVLDRRADRAAGARLASSTSTSPRARSTSGPRSTGPSGSCGATPRPSTGSEPSRRRRRGAAAVGRLRPAQEQPVERHLALAQEALPPDGDHDDEDHREDDLR